MYCIKSLCLIKSVMGDAEAWVDALTSVDASAAQEASRRLVGALQAADAESARREDVLQLIECRIAALERAAGAGGERGAAVFAVLLMISSMTTPRALPAADVLALAAGGHTSGSGSIDGRLFTAATSSPSLSRTNGCQ